MSSILQDTKKYLGIAEDDPSFDVDVMLHINSAFSILSDLGLGPSGGFLIEDEDAEWSEFLDIESEWDPNKGEDIRKAMLGKAKMHVYLKTRLVFDPPASQFVQATITEQITQLEWRLNVNREGNDWVDPNPPVVLEEEEV